MNESKGESPMKNLRNSYLTVLVLFLLGPPIAVLVAFIIGEEFAIAVAGILTAIYVLYGLVVSNSNCPKCQLKFFRRGIFYSCFPRCVHCDASLFKG